jgi:hypothetical protein
MNMRPDDDRLDERTAPHGPGAEARLDELELDASSAPDDLDTGPLGPDERRRPLWPWVAALLLAMAIAGVAWWLNRRPAPDAAEALSGPGVEPTAPPASPAAPAPTEPLPALDASDEMVRRAVQALSSHPRLAAWLATDGLVRRFVTAVANIAEGVTPGSHLETMAPSEPFEVRRAPGSVVPSAKSYARYDAVAQVISSLDAAGTVALYRRLEPLMDEAFAELGYPGRDFDGVLLTALDHLLATPVLQGEPELVETVSGFQYADPQLEGLSGAQKQLLRAGPDNVRQIRATLLALRRELVRG